jgi:hypothetical protein
LAGAAVVAIRTPTLTAYQLTSRAAHLTPAATHNGKSG